MNIHFVFPRSVVVGAVALSVSLGLIGCGGGGGGGNGPSTPRPTPTPVVAVNNAYDKTRFTPNYVTALENAKEASGEVVLLRWRVFPLTVAFVKNDFYTTARQALVVESFNRWVSATGAVTGNDGVTYRVTDNAATANITVNFANFSGGAGDILGTTKSFYNPQSRYIARGVDDTADGTRREVGTQIEIGITGDRNNDLVTATHEFGHALGINGHSPNRPDLMFFEGNDQLGGGITSADLNTLLTSYGGVFNKNPNARFAPSNGEVVQSVIREEAGER